MAKGKLTDEVKTFIVQSLACFDPPAVVVYTVIFVQSRRTPVWRLLQPKNWGAPSAIGKQFADLSDDLGGAV